MIKRIGLVIILLFFSFCCFAGEVLDNADMTLIFDMKNSSHDIRIFGFSSEPVEVFDQASEEQLELETSGSDSDFHASSTFYAYWYVSSVQPFEIILSGTSLQNEKSIWDWVCYWDSLQEGQQTSVVLSSIGREAGELLYEHDPMNGITSEGMVEISLETLASDNLIPGTYQGTITMGIAGK